MRIINHANLEADHLLHLKLSTISSRYRVDRGLEDITAQMNIKFDLLGHLHALASSRRIKVFEGGCGVSTALADVKRGFTFNDNQLDRFRILAPESVLKWKNSIVGKSFPGLGPKVVTDGITLSQEHISVVQELQDDAKPDNISIGSIESFCSEENYDFLFDFFGAAAYFPEAALKKYAVILKKGSLAFIRFDLESYTAEVGSFSDIERITQANGFRIVEWGPNYSGDPKQSRGRYNDLLLKTI